MDSVTWKIGRIYSSHDMGVIILATLDLQGIQCAYGSNVILDDVNISLNNGVTALLGLNGAGKTTLIKTIMRLIKPKEGRIVFNGEDIYKLKS